LADTISGQWGHKTAASVPMKPDVDSVPVDDSGDCLQRFAGKDVTLIRNMLRIVTRRTQ
jgi:hypothetical protein